MSKHSNRLARIEQQAPEPAQHPDLPAVPSILAATDLTEQEAQAELKRRRRLGYTGRILIIDR